MYHIIPNDSPLLNILRPDLNDLLFLRYFPYTFQIVERNNNKNRSKNRPKRA